MQISYVVNQLFFFYFVLILLRIFLSWIPNLDWYSQPLKTLNLLTEGFLSLFRKIIPPFGGLDFSPILAIVVLQVLQRIIVGSLVAAGL